MRTPAIITDKYIRRRIEEQKQLLSAPCVCGHPNSDHAFGCRCNAVAGLTVDALVYCDCERFTPPAPNRATPASSSGNLRAGNEMDFVTRKDDMVTIKITQEQVAFLKGYHDDLVERFNATDNDADAQAILEKIADIEIALHSAGGLGNTEDEPFADA